MYPICWKLSILLKYIIAYQISLKSKHGNKISVTVRDLQTSSRPLIYKTEFSDVNLRIGDNILSQNWRQKKLTSIYFRDKNTFRYFMFTFNLYIFPCKEKHYNWKLFLVILLWLHPFKFCRTHYLYEKKRKI